MSFNMTTSYVVLGSNIDPKNNLTRALDMLSERVDIEALSTVYRSHALGRPAQPDFLNAVVRIGTGMDARSFKFDILKVIERAMGRVRSADKYAARTIDLDILLHGDAVMETPDLTIPDPDIRTRPFLAVPLVEVATRPDMPGTGEELAELARQCDASGLLAMDEYTQRLRGRLGI